jgi:hypothetical protein
MKVWAGDLQALEDNPNTSHILPPKPQITAVALSIRVESSQMVSTQVIQALYAGD